MQIRSLPDNLRPQERTIGEVERLTGFAIHDPFDRILALHLAEPAHVLESKLYLASAAKSAARSLPCRSMRAAPHAGPRTWSSAACIEATDRGPRRCSTKH